MRARNEQRSVAWAVTASLLIHAGLAAWGGELLSAASPNKPRALEVALEFTPPPPEIGAQAFAPAPPPSGPEPGPILAPHPAAPKPEPKAPAPEAPAKPEPEAVPEPVPDPAAQSDQAPEVLAPVPVAAASDPAGQNSFSDAGPGPGGGDPGGFPGGEPGAGGPGGDGPPGVPGPGLFGRGGDVLAAYQREVRRRIEAVKRYPAEARLAGRRGEGVSKVRFEIGSDGAVSAVEVFDSAGLEALDRAAAAAVTDAAPFPPLPEELGRDRIAVVVPIQFKLR